MNNEEKAKEIADFLYFKLSHIDYNTLKRELLEMAQWKDEQFSKFLLWLDDNYVIRRFTDGESMNYIELIDNFKSMEQQ